MSPDTCEVVTLIGKAVLATNVPSTAHPRETTPRNPCAEAAGITYVKAIEKLWRISKSELPRSSRRGEMESGIPPLLSPDASSRECDQV